MIKRNNKFGYILPVVLLGFFISLSVLLPVHAAVNVGQRVTPVTLQDSNGANHNLSSSIGRKTTVIWVCDVCRVCGSGVDNFNTLYAAYSPRGVDFYMISTVDAKMTARFVQQYQIAAPVLLGGADSLTSSLTGMSGFGICPMDNIFVIDRTGILRFKGHLPGTTNRQLENVINQSR